jgi:hypothetical protein
MRKPKFRLSMLTQRHLFVTSRAAWLAIALLQGCSDSSRVISGKHSGDLAPFILKVAGTLGGVAKVTNGIPRLETTWRCEVRTGGEYLGGREEVQIHLKWDLFGELTNLLVHSFGQPSRITLTTADGSVHGYYTIEDAGVALQFYRAGRESGLILVGTRKQE